MRTFTLVFALTVAAFASGCASQMLSDDRLKSNTAGALGVAPEDLTISGRREQTPNTYYVAKTSAGVEYACILNGGNLMTMGMTNPPICNKK